MMPPLRLSIWIWTYLTMFILTLPEKGSQWFKISEKKEFLLFISSPCFYWIIQPSSPFSLCYISRMCFQLQGQGHTDKHQPTPWCLRMIKLRIIQSNPIQCPPKWLIQNNRMVNLSSCYVHVEDSLRQYANLTFILLIILLGSYLDKIV